MQSLLIIGGNLEKRKEKTKELSVISYQLSVVDTLIIRGNNSIGIDKVRELEQWASRKPHSSKFKSAIIYEAEKLTHQAQNALLKTLEEPPANTLIVLAAPKESLLLSTIISRCRIIRLKSESEVKLDKKSCSDLLSVFCSLLSDSPGQRIQKAEKYSKTRDEALLFLNQLILSLRTLLLHKCKITQSQAIVHLCAKTNLSDSKSSEKEIARIIRLALQTRQMIKKNVNTKLALENFSLIYLYWNDRMKYA